MKYIQVDLFETVPIELDPMYLVLQTITKDSPVLTLSNNITVSLNSKGFYEIETKHSHEISHTLESTYSCLLQLIQTTYIIV